MASRRNGRALAVATAPVRCAIYTRKSTDEGLTRDFNSLDNQRERGEAYAASQGWAALSTRYDDGGFSGGNVERPALKRLLADVEAGQLDTLVVYRLDRLSRSLADFTRIHEFLEKRHVALVSVTESINTSTPHGRMMVNVLLSFAQYERELVGERTRHKIHGARRRGKWTGGFIPLGYDSTPEGGSIVVNNDGAEQVKAIFQLYVETPSLVQVAAELNRRGWLQKSWTTKTGTQRQGRTWDRVSLRRLLTNPVYIGKMTLGEETFRAEHDGIVPKTLFDRVQRLMNENLSTGNAAARNQHGALLRGLLRCAACDRAMSHLHTTAHGRLYRYYTCQKRQKEGAAACPTKSVKADDVERFIVDQIRRIGADPVLQEATFQQAIAQVKAQRRRLKAEAIRLDRDLAAVRNEVERLVGLLPSTPGVAADAVRDRLEKAQERVAALEARQREVESELQTLAGQNADPADVARALQEFDELWSVLLTPERERVLGLLVERIDYNGESGQLKIHWRLAGLGTFVAEVAP